MICPYILAALISNINTYSVHEDAIEAAECLQRKCQMWTGKYFKNFVAEGLAVNIDDEGIIGDCALKGEVRI